MRIESESDSPQGHGLSAEVESWPEDPQVEGGDSSAASGSGEHSAEAAAVESGSEVAIASRPQTGRVVVGDRLYGVLEVPGDGDCFFTSVLASASRQFPDSPLRHLGVAHLREHVAAWYESDEATALREMLDDGMGEAGEIPGAFAGMRFSEGVSRAIREVGLWNSQFFDPVPEIAASALASQGVDVSVVQDRGESGTAAGGRPGAGVLTRLVGEGEPLLVFYNGVDHYSAMDAGQPMERQETQPRQPPAPQQPRPKADERQASPDTDSGMKQAFDQARQSRILAEAHEAHEAHEARRKRSGADGGRRTAGSWSSSGPVRLGSARPLGDSPWVETERETQVKARPKPVSPVDTDSGITGGTGHSGPVGGRQTADDPPTTSGKRDEHRLGRHPWPQRLLSPQDTRVNAFHEARRKRLSLERGHRSPKDSLRQTMRFVAAFTDAPDERSAAAKQAFDQARQNRILAEAHEAHEARRKRSGADGGRRTAGSWSSSGPVRLGSARPLGDSPWVETERETQVKARPKPVSPVLPARRPPRIVRFADLPRGGDADTSSPGQAGSGGVGVGGTWVRQKSAGSQTQTVRPNASGGDSAGHGGTGTRDTGGTAPYFSGRGRRLDSGEAPSSWEPPSWTQASLDARRARQEGVEPPARPGSTAHAPSAEGPALEEAAARGDSHAAGTDRPVHHVGTADRTEPVKTATVNSAQAESGTRSAAADGASYDYESARRLLSEHPDAAVSATQEALEMMRALGARIAPGDEIHLLVAAEMVRADLESPGSGLPAGDRLARRLVPSALAPEGWLFGGLNATDSVDVAAALPDLGRSAIYGVEGDHEPGSDHIVVDGQRDGTRQTYRPSEVAEQARAAGLGPDKVLVLPTSWSGSRGPAGEPAFAERVAAKLGGAVLAPRGPLVHLNGREMVTASVGVDEHGAPVMELAEDDDGWSLYFPDGSESRQGLALRAALRQRDAVRVTLEGLSPERREELMSDAAALVEVVAPGDGLSRDDIRQRAAAGMVWSGYDLAARLARAAAGPAPLSTTREGTAGRHRGDRPVPTFEAARRLLGKQPVKGYESAMRSAAVIVRVATGRRPSRADADGQLSRVDRLRILVAAEIVRADRARPRSGLAAGAALARTLTGDGGVRLGSGRVKPSRPTPLQAVPEEPGAGEPVAETSGAGEPGGLTRGQDPDPDPSSPTETWRGRPVYPFSQIDEVRPTRIERNAPLPSLPDGPSDRWSDGAQLPPHISEGRALGAGEVTFRDGVAQRVTEAAADVLGPLRLSGGWRDALTEALGTTEDDFFVDGLAFDAMSPDGPVEVHVRAVNLRNWDRFQYPVVVTRKAEREHGREQAKRNVARVEKPETVTRQIWRGDITRVGRLDSRSLGQTRRITVRIPIGPGTGHWSPFGIASVGVQNNEPSYFYQSGRRTQSAWESRGRDGTHVHVDDVRFDFTVFGNGSNGRRAQTPLLPRRSVTVYGGLSLALSDSLAESPAGTADINNKLPERFDIPEHTMLDLHSIEAVGPVEPVLRAALSQMPEADVIGSIARRELRAVYSAARLVSGLERMTHGWDASAPLYANDAGGKVIGAVRTKAVLRSAERVSVSEDITVRSLTQGRSESVRELRRTSRQAVGLDVGPVADYVLGPLGARFQAGLGFQLSHSSSQSARVQSVAWHQRAPESKGVSGVYRVNLDYYVQRTGREEAERVPGYVYVRLTQGAVGRITDGGQGPEATRQETPHAPPYLTGDDPRTLGVAGVRSIEGVDAFRKRTVRALAEQYPRLVAKWSQLDYDSVDEHGKRVWSNRGEHRVALENVLRLETQISRAGMAGGLENLLGRGLSIRLHQYGRLYKTHVTVNIRARMSNRSFGGTDPGMNVKVSTASYEASYASQDASHSATVGVPVGLIGSDANRDHAVGLALTAQRTWGRRRTSRFGQATTNESLVSVGNDAHVWAYDVEFTAEARSFKRLRHVYRTITLQIAGAQRFTRHAPQTRLVPSGEDPAGNGGKVQLRSTGKIELWVPSSLAPKKHPDAPRHDPLDPGKIVIPDDGVLSRPEGHDNGFFHALSAALRRDLPRLAERSPQEIMAGGPLPEHVHTGRHWSPETTVLVANWVARSLGIDLTLVREDGTFDTYTGTHDPQAAVTLYQRGDVYRAVVHHRSTSTQPLELDSKEAVDQVLSLASRSGTRTDPSRRPWYERPHYILPLQHTDDLTESVLRQVGRATGDSWQYLTPGAPAHDSLLDTFSAEWYTAGLADMAGRGPGLRLGGVVARRTMTDRTTSVGIRAEVGQLRVIGEPIDDTELEIGVMGEHVAQGGRGRSRNTNLSGSLGPRNTSQSSGRQITSVQLTLYDRTREASRTSGLIASDGYNRVSKGRLVLVSADVTYTVMARSRRIGVLVPSPGLGVGDQALGRHTAVERLTVPDGVLMLIPEDDAREMARGGELAGLQPPEPPADYGQWTLPDDFLAMPHSWLPESSLDFAPAIRKLAERIAASPQLPDHLLPPDILEDFSGNTLQVLSITRSAASHGLIDAMVNGGVPVRLYDGRQLQFSPYTIKGTPTPPIKWGPVSARLLISVELGQPGPGRLRQGNEFEFLSEMFRTQLERQSGSTERLLGLTQIGTTEGGPVGLGGQFADSGGYLSQSVVSSARNQLAASRSVSSEPSVEFDIPATVRLSVVSDDPAIPPIDIVEDAGHLRAQMPVSIARSGGAPSHNDHASANRPEPRTLPSTPTLAELAAWQRDDAFRLPEFSHVAMVGGVPELRRAATLALAAAEGRPHRAGRTGLTRPGHVPDTLLHNAISSTMLRAGFREAADGGHGLDVPGMTRNHVLGEVEARLHAFVRLDLRGARLLSVSEDVGMSSTAFAATTVTQESMRTDHHAATAGPFTSLTDDLLSRVSPNPSGPVFGDRDGSGQIRSVRSSRRVVSRLSPGQVFTFRVPATWRFHGEVPSLGTFGLARTARVSEVRVENGVVIKLTENDPVDRGLITRLLAGANHTEPLTRRADDVAARVHAWTEADKAFQAARREVSTLRDAAASGKPAEGLDEAVAGMDHSRLLAEDAARALAESQADLHAYLGEASRGQGRTPGLETIAEAGEPVETAAATEPESAELRRLAPAIPDLPDHPHGRAAALRERLAGLEPSYRELLLKTAGQPSIREVEAGVGKLPQPAFDALQRPFLGLGVLPVVIDNGSPSEARTLAFRDEWTQRLVLSLHRALREDGHSLTDLSGDELQEHARQVVHALGLKQRHAAGVITGWDSNESWELAHIVGAKHLGGFNWSNEQDERLITAYRKFKLYRPLYCEANFREYAHLSFKDLPTHQDQIARRAVWQLRLYPNTPRLALENQLSGWQFQAGVHDEWDVPKPNEGARWWLGGGILPPDPPTRGVSVHRTPEAPGAAAGFGPGSAGGGNAGAATPGGPLRNVFTANPTPATGSRPPSTHGGTPHPTTPGPLRNAFTANPTPATRSRPPSTHGGTPHPTTPRPPLRNPLTANPGTAAGFGPGSAGSRNAGAATPGGPLRNVFTANPTPATRSRPPSTHGGTPHPTTPGPLRNPLTANPGPAAGSKPPSTHGGISDPTTPVPWNVPLPWPSSTRQQTGRVVVGNRVYGVLEVPGDGDCFFTAVLASASRQFPDSALRGWDAARLRDHVSAWFDSDDAAALRTTLDEVGRAMGVPGASAGLPFSEGVSLAIREVGWWNTPFFDHVPALTGRALLASHGFDVGVVQDGGKSGAPADRLPTAGVLTRLVGQGAPLLVFYNGVNHYSAMDAGQPMGQQESRPPSSFGRGMGGPWTGGAVRSRANSMGTPRASQIHVGPSPTRYVSPFAPRQSVRGGSPFPGHGAPPAAPPAPPSASGSSRASTPFGPSWQWPDGLAERARRVSGLRGSSGGNSPRTPMRPGTFTTRAARAVWQVIYPNKDEAIHPSNTDSVWLNTLMRYRELAIREAWAVAVKPPPTSWQPSQDHLNTPYAQLSAVDQLLRRLAYRIHKDWDLEVADPLGIEGLASSLLGGLDGAALARSRDYPWRDGGPGGRPFLDGGPFFDGGGQAGWFAEPDGLRRSSSTTGVRGGVGSAGGRTRRPSIGDPRPWFYDLDFGIPPGGRATGMDGRWGAPSDRFPGLPDGWSTSDAGHGSEEGWAGLGLPGEPRSSGRVHTDRWIPFRNAFAFEFTAPAENGTRALVIRPAGSGERTEVGYTWSWYRGARPGDDTLQFTRRVHLIPHQVTPDQVATLRRNLLQAAHDLVNQRHYRLPAIQPDQITGPHLPGPLVHLDVQFTDTPEEADTTVHLHAGQPTPGRPMRQDTWYIGVHPAAHLHELLHGLGVRDDRPHSRTLLLPGGHTPLLLPGHPSLMGPLHHTSPSSLVLTPDHLRQIADTLTPHLHHNADTNTGSPSAEAGPITPSASPVVESALDPQWCRAVFEQAVGVHYYGAPDALRAARTAVARLREVLLAAYPQHDAEVVDGAFFTTDPTSAGQVGPAADSSSTQWLDSLLDTGTVRELMTAFANAVGRKALYEQDGQVPSLTSVLRRVLSAPEPGHDGPESAVGMSLAARLGLDRSALEAYAAFLHGGPRAELERRVAADPRTRERADLFSVENPLALGSLAAHRAKETVKDPLEIVHSELTRIIQPADQRAAGPKTKSSRDYTYLGAPLTGRERTFLRRHERPLSVVGFDLEDVPLDTLEIDPGTGDPMLSAVLARPEVVTVEIQRPSLNGHQAARQQPGVPPVHRPVEKVTAVIRAPKMVENPSAADLPLDGAQGSEFPLAWVEGMAHWRLDERSPWYRHWHDTKGMLLISGVSGSTLRLLRAFQWLNVPDTGTADFRKALMGWMLPSQDHSLFEILRASYLADAASPHEEAALHGTAAELYAVPGLIPAHLTPPTTEPATRSTDVAPAVDYRLVHPDDRPRGSVVPSKPDEELFRFSNRPPEEIFRHGFHPDSQDVSDVVPLSHWVTRNPRAPFLSTTRDLEHTYWSNVRRYRYPIHPRLLEDPQGIDVFATIMRNNPLCLLAHVIRTIRASTTISPSELRDASTPAGYVALTATHPEIAAEVFALGTTPAELYAFAGTRGESVFELQAYNEPDAMPTARSEKEVAFTGPISPRAIRGVYDLKELRNGVWNPLTQAVIWGPLFSIPHTHGELDQLYEAMIRQEPS
ncbi:OTU domain-containing protein [Streptomyces chartreusis]|uniref:OTU domain-containing protein n=1 Tax=Streptomyces chartreusis TaxID=1969 RepID=UPI00382FA52F